MTGLSCRWSSEHRAVVRCVGVHWNYTTRDVECVMDLGLSDRILWHASSWMVLFLLLSTLLGGDVLVVQFCGIPLTKKKKAGRWVKLHILLRSSLIQASLHLYIAAAKRPTKPSIPQRGCELVGYMSRKRAAGVWERVLLLLCHRQLIRHRLSHRGIVRDWLPPLW